MLHNSYWSPGQKTMQDTKTKPIYLKHFEGLKVDELTVLFRFDLGKLPPHAGPPTFSLFSGGLHIALLSRSDWLSALSVFTLS